MEELKLLILAIIQGLTEPLPISSSGHLIIAEDLLGMNLPGYGFELFLNFGSLLGVIVFFWHHLIGIVKSIDKKDTWIDILKIPIAVIPVGLVGFFLGDYFEVFKTSVFVACFLLVTGFILFIPRYMSGARKVGFIDSVFVSIAHIIALIPGISRSGITTSTAIARGVSKEEAFKFSFLIYIPLSLISGLYSLYMIEEFNWYYVVYFLVAAVTTYLGLLLFKKFLFKERLHFFSYYCFLLALIILII